jgi:replication factor C subunit 3/5
VEKYRPDDLNDIVSHTHITTALHNLISADKLPNLILYGPSGTGKTTTILACAKKIYGNNINSMVLELNGSDDRGINIVREQIKDFSSTNNLLINDGLLKLVILDEADSMTYDAQFALKRMIENYSNMARFCFICNYITKIIPGIQSRCITFNFSPISDARHLEYLNDIVAKESVQITDRCLREIVKVSEGDMRRSINILQSLHTGYKHAIDIDDMYNTTGHPNIQVRYALIEAIKSTSTDEAYRKTLQLKVEHNLCVNDILKEVMEHSLEVVEDDTKLAQVLTHLAKIEVYLANNVNDNIQLGGIIGTIKQFL